MFGYVVPLKQEMKIKHYEAFQAVYCGLCKTLGERYPAWTRLALNYDFTFLALLLMAVDGGEITPMPGHCMLHPLKKKKFYRHHPALDYAADMTLLLGYYRMADDVRDEKKWSAFLGKGVLSAVIKRIQTEYPEIAEAIVRQLERLHQLEQAQSAETDAVADCFAVLMQVIFEKYPSAGENALILGNIGYNIGRFIYLADAFCDLPKDVPKKQYNPLWLKYQREEGENPQTVQCRAKEPTEQSLLFSLDTAARSFELLSVYHFREVLENIFYDGLKHKLWQVLNPDFAKKGKNNEKSV